MYLICDNISEVFGVKKICYINKVKVSFICLKDQKDSVVETYEKTFLYVSNKIYSHCHFGLRAKDIVHSDYVYVVFFVGKNI